MPGGKQQAGESVEDAGVRELLEETGLKATEVTRAPVYTDTVFNEEGRHYVALFVIAEVPDGEPRLTEPDKFEEWRWASWDDLPKPRFPALQQMVDHGYRPPGV